VIAGARCAYCVLTRDQVNLCGAGSGTGRQCGAFELILEHDPFSLAAIHVVDQVQETLDALTQAPIRSGAVRGSR